MLASENLETDDLSLARLVCSKLLMLLKGTTSFGLTLCLASPEGGELQHFLLDRHDTIQSHLVVLRCLRLKPSYTHLISQLRGPIERLLEVEAQLHRSFQLLPQWRTIAIAELRAIVGQSSDAYVEFVKILHSFAESVGHVLSTQDEIDQGCASIDQFLIEVLREKGGTER
jgi:hypothetical protein